MLVVQSIASDPRLTRLEERLAGCRGIAHVSGLWGSSARMVVGLLAARSTRPYLYVTSHLEQADAARDDLELFSGLSCALFPAWEAAPGEGAAWGEIAAERMELCARLHRADYSRHEAGPRLIVAPIQALMQPVPSPSALEQQTLHVRVGMRLTDRDPVGQRSTTASAARLRTPEPRREDVKTGPYALVACALDHGFTQLELVESPGDVAHRGDIVDLFAPGQTEPYRIEFLDEEVESIRRFDVSTQRSTESLTAISVTALGHSVTGAQDVPLADLITYLPADTLVALDHPDEIQAMGETLHARMGPESGLYKVCDTLERLAHLSQVHLTAFGTAPTRDEDAFDMAVASLSRFEGSAADAVAELCALARDRDVHVVCDTGGERQRLTEMIAESPAGGREVASRTNIHVGVLHRGFEWSATGTVVVPHHEIFHRHRQRRRLRRVHAGRTLDSWLDLKPGELVVHVVHGIGLYRGLKRLRKGDSHQREEFLCLEFANKARVFVPCSQIDLVQKYIGAGGRRPELSKLGGKRWETAKKQVADAVSELAESLLRVQAAREEAGGTAYPPNTDWQREFEAAFPYEETEDQLLVAGEIRDDLCRTRPMDRLVCGDVGYGKTELAMRAAFKVMEYGRQVAVLVPTTVLADQHYTTFRDRMAEYPFVIESLSRFRLSSEQKRTIDRLKKGHVDVVIGTHRLLSKDVAFADLGLVIIDEEQRFGVEHKERLKAMRETVDVLTLTATPIPRTLHMSLMGIRDISSLQTPPIDRRSIVTRISTFDRQLIRDAILREMNRDGQVYFLHNFVRSIAAVADTVRAIVPEARVLYAHGQMNDKQLENVMHRFLHREADVLVTTTIIESGIDIPTVNTIFINRAERFGLADLHQLRGRVGRSNHRAYCYLLLSPDRPPTSKAAKRLKTIEEFSELGAGFRIAMRDLEIRGAGNLLGKEQSGHIAAVGYEMYCRLLEKTVRRLKNEPDPTPPPVHVDLDVAAHVPQHYVAADRSRIEIYRRIVQCRTETDLTQLKRDLVDAFGPVPSELERLIDLAEIRVHARRFGIRSISWRPPDVVFLVDQFARAAAAFEDAPGSVRLPDPETVHLRLQPADRSPEDVVRIVRDLLLKPASYAHATTK